MSTFIIVLILLVIVFFAVKSVVHRIRYGSSCCGERDAAEKKVKVADKNKSHYQHNYLMKVDGMRCSNCVRHVENALNSIEGIWATADLEKKQILIRAKNRMEENMLQKTVMDAGYTPLSIEAV